MNLKANKMGSWRTPSCGKQDCRLCGYTQRRTGLCHCPHFSYVRVCACFLCAYMQHRTGLCHVLSVFLVCVCVCVCVYVCVCRYFLPANERGSCTAPSPRRHDCFLSEYTQRRTGLCRVLPASFWDHGEKRSIMNAGVYTAAGHREEIRSAV